MELSNKDNYYDGFISELRDKAARIDFKRRGYNGRTYNKGNSKK